MCSMHFKLNQFDQKKVTPGEPAFVWDAVDHCYDSGDARTPSVSQRGSDCEKLLQRAAPQLQPFHQLRGSSGGHGGGGRRKL